MDMHVQSSGEEGSCLHEGVVGDDGSSGQDEVQVHQLQQAHPQLGARPCTVTGKHMHSRSATAPKKPLGAANMHAHITMHAPCMHVSVSA